MAGRKPMICPTGWSKSFLKMIWEDDVKPKIINTAVLLSFVFMGSLFGFVIILAVLVISRLISFIV